MEFFFSKPKILSFQLCCLLGAITIGVICFPRDGILFDLGAVFAGLVISPCFLLVPALRKSSAQVIINDEGIQDNRLQWGMIKWEDVLSISIKHFYLMPLIVFELKDPTARREQIRASGGKIDDKVPFGTAFFFMQPSQNDALAYIQSRHPEKFKRNVA